jgi:hypothetical protein
LRCDEVGYSWIIVIDIVMFVVQIIVSAIYLGSWVTFAIVRAPRLVMDILSKIYFPRLVTKDKKMKFLKAE